MFALKQLKEPIKGKGVNKMNKKVKISDLLANTLIGVVIATCLFVGVFYTIDTIEEDKHRKEAFNNAQQKREKQYKKDMQELKKLRKDCGSVFKGEIKGGKVDNDTGEVLHNIKKSKITAVEYCPPPASIHHNSLYDNTNTLLYKGELRLERLTKQEKVNTIDAVKNLAKALRSNKNITLHCPPVPPHEVHKYMAYNNTIPVGAYDKYGKVYYKTY